MVDVLRKHVSSEQRILVDAKAFLNTEFRDACLFFTGGHIELMRNLVEYANRRSTFVSDYYIGYYLSPDDTDWNLIQQSVAELESVLMGTNVVVWGYTDRYYENIEDDSMPAGVQDKLGAVVPEGEVWEVTGISFIHSSGSINRVRVGSLIGAEYINVGEKLAPDANTLYYFPCDVILKEDDRVFWRFYNLTLNDDVFCWCWGSKMAVPV